MVEVKAEKKHKCCPGEIPTTEKAKVA